MTDSIEVLTGIYVLISIIGSIQFLRKRRSAFLLGLLCQVFMFTIIMIDPKLYWFIAQMIVYGSINIVGLLSPKWKNDPWL